MNQPKAAVVAAFGQELPLLGVDGEAGVTDELVIKLRSSTKVRVSSGPGSTASPSGQIA